MPLSFFRPLNVVCILLILSVWLCYPKTAAAEDEEVVIAVPAFWGVAKTEQQWQPLADYLTQEIPEYRFAIRAFQLPDLERAVISGQADFVFVNPSIYVLYTYHLGLSSPLATLANRVKGQDISQFAGVIFTRSELTDLKNLSDLKQRKVAAVSPSSLGAYQMQRYRLHQEGLEVEEDLQMQFTGLPLTQVVDAVLSGEADAGFIRAGVLEELVEQGELKPEDYRLLGVKEHVAFPLQVSTALYPEWAFAALSHVSKDLSRRVSGALLSMPLGGEVAQQLNISGFTIPGDYRVIDQLLRELRLPPFDQLPELTWAQIWQQLYAYLLFLVLVLVSVLTLFTLHLYRSNKALKRSQDHIHHLAYYEPLTGLPNRSFLLESLEKDLQCPHGKRLNLLLLNLDHFKTINNARGSRFADGLLRHIAGLLEQHLKREISLFHMSGDEFALLYSSPEIAGQVQAIFSEPVNIDGEYLHLSVSTGSTKIRAGDCDETAELIIGRASMALYTAKQQGGQTSVHFESAMAEHISQKFQVEKELPLAIESGELRLFLQSQVDSLAQVKSAEVLVRWQHPQKGLLSPGYFVPIAEESNLIVDLGRWVLTNACRLLGNRIEQGLNALPLAVNISPRHFRQSDFVNEVADCLQRYRVPAHYLTLEVTESLVIDDLEVMREKMFALRQLGVRLSIDDFGTGYSALSYLKRLPIDEIKIDQSFVQGVTRDKEDAALVEVIIAVAEKLDLDVVAEGVETQEQADFLKRHGQVLHQGYLYCKPMPGDIWYATCVDAGDTAPIMSR